MAQEISGGEVEWLLSKEGLNKYQRSAYSALLSLREAEVGEIASASKVPESKLYEVLRSLEARGLVHAAFGRPKKYSVVDPKKAFTPGIEKKMGELEAERRLLDKVGKLVKKSPEQEDVIRLMKGRENVLSHATSYVRESVKTTYEACFPFNNAYVPMMNLIRQKAVEGVKVRLIGEVVPENYEIVKKYLKWGVEVRNSKKVSPPQPLRFSIYDQRAALFTLTSADRGYISIWTDSKPMVQSIQDLFTYYWSNGLKVE